MAREPYNPRGTSALVTGASSGLGVGYARELARRGADLILVARRQDRLEALAVELAERHGTVSTVIPLDLARTDAVDELVADLRERDVTVGTLVNNAGFATYGSFVDSDSARALDEIAVNVSALTALTRAFLPDLLSTALAHPRGAALLNVSSMAGFQPVPHMAVYGATKAYVLNFTEAVWYETRRTGLAVRVVCPGPVETEFFEVAGRGSAKGMRTLTVADVMQASFEALDRPSAPAHTLVGNRNRAMVRLSTLGPRRTVVRAVGRLNRPGRFG